MAIDRRRSGGFLPLRDAIDQLFETSFITPQLLSGGGFPLTDIFVTEDDVLVQMAIPGANPDDINVSVTGDTVTVSGEMRSPQEGRKGQAYLQETWSGRFQRSFTLPLEVDANKAEASFENGVLTLTLPKSEATKPRKIQVKQQQTLQGQSGGEVQSEKVPVQSGQSS
jgi:HSP20 family protein